MLNSAVCTEQKLQDRLREHPCLEQQRYGVHKTSVDRVHVDGYGIWKEGIETCMQLRISLTEGILSAIGHRPDSSTSTM